MLPIPILLSVLWIITKFLNFKFCENALSTVRVIKFWIYFFFYYCCRQKCLILLWHFLSNVSTVLHSYQWRHICPKSVENVCWVWKIACFAKYCWVLCYFLKSWRVDVQIQKVQMYVNFNVGLCVCTLCVNFVCEPRSSNPDPGWSCVRVWWGPPPPCWGPKLPLHYWDWATTRESAILSVLASDEIWVWDRKKQRDREKDVNVT